MRVREVDEVELGPTGLPVLTPEETALGWPEGYVVPVPPPPDEVDPNPAVALRAALLPALRRSPCMVAFSGGRDSSLLLAVAADVAAREGLPPPIALTFRYPGDRAADESAWQELVVGHLRGLGLRFAWTLRDIDTELDCIGPLMRPVLRAHGGPTFPATLANTILLTRSARGGSLVTGNGGDEVVDSHRMGVLRTVVRRHGRGLTRSDWQAVLGCLYPSSVHRLPQTSTLPFPVPWLRPGARSRLRALMRNQAQRPLRWDHSVWRALAPRAVAIGNQTRAEVARGYECALVEPLCSPSFVASYAAYGGRWGGLTRAGGIRMLGGGLLPDALVLRADKAYFNGSRFGRLTREFAREWDGRGVDERLVDPEALRDAWLADVPPAPTAMLLQQAWLAGDRR